MEPIKNYQPLAVTASLPDALRILSQFIAHFAVIGGDVDKIKIHYEITRGASELGVSTDCDSSLFQIQSICSSNTYTATPNTA